MAYTDRTEARRVPTTCTVEPHQLATGLGDKAGTNYPQAINPDVAEGTGGGTEPFTSEGVPAGKEPIEGLAYAAF